MLSRISLLTVLLCPAISFADDVPAAPGGKPGHSTHGDAFDEGPRQAAVLMRGMGSVSFKITTQSGDTQKFFDQGVAQLHGFWYYESERSFRQAAKFDPAAPMPYWGMAMSNVNNEKRAVEFMKQAMSRREKGTPRERLYIDAYNAYFTATKKDGDANKVRRTALVKALEKIAFEFPDDVEAKAFLMFQVWDNSQKGMPVSSHAALAALANEVFAKNPTHPGAHHYIIHLWNHEDDRRALKSAAVDGQSAPGIAHLWHMPGHTFTAQHRYAEAAWQQEAAARTDHAYMIATKLMPEQIHNYAHNNDWLVENLGFIGRVNDAIDLAKNMIELPRLSRGHALVGKPAYTEERGGYQMGRRRLTDALLAWERWDALLALDGGPYLPVLEDPTEEAKRLRAMGVAAFQKGDKTRGAAKAEAIRQLIVKTKQERTAKADEAEAAAKTAKKPADQIAKAIADALVPFIQRSGQLEKLNAELEVYRALAEGRTADARKQLDKVADVPKSRLARLHELSGDSAKAVQLAREAVKETEGQVQPLANLADLLWRKGDKKDALEIFQKLRPLCAQADLDQPVFTRLRVVADELKLPADWRPKLEFPPDSGKRPDLASLGPFRWHPYAAPDWNLPDQTGETRLFAEFKGKPTLMLFYLGSGCSHCIEQLNTFGPMAKEFEAAGINLVAVGTERAEDLHKTYALAKEGDGFSFPILGDATLATFKSYRAFDDFETMPLHGTFLIDTEGLVRWQDISYQPFTQAKWLLAESKRLLALPRNVAAKTLSSNPTTSIAQP
ncbi:MAG: redoxin domain-containing protein [Chthoniobacteraceae bacterium]